ASQAVAQATSSAKKKSKSSEQSSSKAKSTKAPARTPTQLNPDLCTNLSCPGKPTCSKIHIADILGPASRDDHSRQRRPESPRQPAPPPPKQVSKVKKSATPAGLCTDITCRGAGVCPKLHMTDFMT
ncbi:unnamed protein product, partial [Dibothriocephalus latus]